MALTCDVAWLILFAKTRVLLQAVFTVSWALQRMTSGNGNAIFTAVESCPLMIGEVIYPRWLVDEWGQRLWWVRES